jgi:hypothetical protein
MLKLSRQVALSAAGGVPGPLADAPPSRGFFAARRSGRAVHAMAA